MIRRFDVVPVAGDECAPIKLHHDGGDYVDAKVAQDIFDELYKVHELISRLADPGFNPMAEPAIAEELFLGQGARSLALKKAISESYE